jgi:hypothetical protein
MYVCATENLTLADYSANNEALLLYFLCSHMIGQDRLKRFISQACSVTNEKAMESRHALSRIKGLDLFRVSYKCLGLQDDLITE